MMAAISAAEAGARVTLLDGNEKTGKKLYITGKGRCNLTNACDAEEFLRNVPRNPRFLMSCFSAFDNRALMDYVERMGVPLKVERGERVFPQSEKASDISRALNRRMEELGVRVKLRCPVLSVQAGMCVRTQQEEISCDAVIIATGGCSYPVTGSTGDGYRFARELGHTVTAPRASLVPLETREDWPRTLQGLTLKNVELSAKAGKKTIFSEQGEMLFTHFGVTGPLTLSLSAHLPEDLTSVRAFIDMKPALTVEQLDARLLRDFEQAQRKQLSTVLPGLVPGSMGPMLAQLCGIDPATPVHQITRVQRATLCATLKAMLFTLRAARPIQEAVVTRGGVDVREVSPKTMESKLVGGLYFAGEVLDVDAYTGGFNLQIAFSTGRAAGLAAATREAEA